MGVFEYAFTFANVGHLKVCKYTTKHCFTVRYKLFEVLVSLLLLISFVFK